jgi:co-chaperonin GroES (HSP10)
MIRPLTGQVLLRVLPKDTQSAGGIEFPQRSITPEEQQELNHHPEPPPPELCYVEAIGPWPKIKCGLALPPPFPAGATVLVRPASGTHLARNIGERLKLVHVRDVLAVVS